MIFTLEALQARARRRAAPPLRHRRRRSSPSIDGGPPASTSDSAAAAAGGARARERAGGGAADDRPDDGQPHRRRPHPRHPRPDARGRRARRTSQPAAAVRDRPPLAQLLRRLLGNDEVPGGGDRLARSRRLRWATAGVAPRRQLSRPRSCSRASSQGRRAPRRTLRRARLAPATPRSRGLVCTAPRQVEDMVARAQDRRRRAR